MDNKGQVSGGLVTGLVFGIAALIIGVIIAFVMISAISGAGLLGGHRTSTTVTNESGTLDATPYTLATVTTSRTSYSVLELWANTSVAYELVPTANYTVDSTTGIVTRAGTEDYSDALYTYTYATKTAEELSADRLILNFSAGVDNVSAKVPTILLIAAIVLILGVLAVLVAIWQRMRMGGGQI